MASMISRYSSDSGRVVDEVEVPQFRMVEVGEAAVDQAADEVERQRRPLVAAQQQLGVGRAILRREAAAG